MKRSLLAAIAALSICSVTPSFGQVVIDLSPEQRTVIREHVVRERVPAVRIQGDIRVGASLPADVELVAVPDAWGPSVRRYRYVHWNDKVILVEPGNRRVVQIID